MNVPVAPRPEQLKATALAPADGRPVVLCAVRHYLPGYRSGGPVRSLSRLVEELGDAFDIRVVCLDRDSANEGPYTQVVARRWTRVGKASVMYLRPEERTAAVWREILDDARPNLLYVNSLFDPGFSIRPLWLATRMTIPTLVAPRGELAPGALGVKPMKKRVALAVLPRLAPYVSARWHASSDEEAAQIRAHFRHAHGRVTVVPNLPSVDPIEGSPWPVKAPGTLRAMFLGRIAPNKNTLGAIACVARAGSGVRLEIWGPVEHQVYAQACRAAASAITSGAEVAWRGAVGHADIREQMVRHDVLLLPTLGENFGHAIFEALAAGLPVIVSDRTPWRGLQEHGVGADLPAEDIEAFAHELRHFRDMDQSSLLAVRHRCVAFAAEWCNRHPGAEAYREMWSQSPNRLAGGQTRS